MCTPTLARLFSTSCRLGGSSDASVRFLSATFASKKGRPLAPDASSCSFFLASASITATLSFARPIVSSLFFSIDATTVSTILACMSLTRFEISSRWSWMALAALSVAWSAIVITSVTSPPMLPLMSRMKIHRRSCEMATCRSISVHSPSRRVCAVTSPAPSGLDLFISRKALIASGPPPSASLSPSKVSAAAATIARLITRCHVSAA